MIENNTLTYSNQLILWVLENYETLSNGSLPGVNKDDYGVQIAMSKMLTAKFVKPIELVSDIDRAIQSLKPTERGVVIARCISGWSTEQVTSWYGFESWLKVQNTEQYCIRKMKRFLNGGENDHKNS
jgi:hypothetical protein